MENKKIYARIENGKIYARQVPPEHQESPLDYSEWPENVYAFGNDRYIAHIDGLEEICNALENIAGGLEDIANGNASADLAALVWYELPRENGEKYTCAERSELAKLAEEYSSHWGWRNTDYRIIARVLELVRGEKYEHAIIRGCCQGDWQEIIYPASYGDAFRDAFETEYFNTGTEWIIHYGCYAPENPDEIDGYPLYCYTHDPRAEIAEAYNTDPKNVTLYEFDGYTRRASWRAV